MFITDSLSVAGQGEGYGERIRVHKHTGAKRQTLPRIA